MRKRVGTKIYDTETSTLLTRTDDGVEVYKKDRSPDIFLYNPNAKNKHEMFYDLPAEEAQKYLSKTDDLSTKVRGSTRKIQVSDYDMERIRRLAYSQGMSMSKFLLMLVDQYESEHTDRGN